MSVQSSAAEFTRDVPPVNLFLSALGVVREGRFDYKVKVDNPDFDARPAILRTLISTRPHSDRLSLTELAHDLAGFSAAQIRSIVDEAALAALEAGRPILGEHLRTAY